MNFLSDLFKPNEANPDIIKPIPYIENLWNHEWHSIEFQVAGVTFENRQAILKKIDNRKPHIIFFKKSTYEDSPCVEVYANKKMIGYVPQKRLNEFLKWSIRPCSIKFERIVYAKNTYGFTINVIFQNIIPIEKRKLISEKSWLIVGESYECRKNKKKMRKDVIKKMHINDKVLIERYIYDGKAAYMVVDPKSKLDLGVLSAGVAEYLSTNYSNAVFEAHLEDKYKDSYHVHINIYV